MSFFYFEQCVNCSGVMPLENVRSVNSHRLLHVFDSTYLAAILKFCKQLIHETIRFLNTI